jgi:hypothetical protein
VATDRDRSVVVWVAVIGAASAQDVMARFRLGRTVGYRRLAALVECGLLSRQRLVYGQPALYTATRDGLAWGIPQSNRRLPPAEPVGGVGAPRRVTADPHAVSRLPHVATRKARRPGSSSLPRGSRCALGGRVPSKRVGDQGGVVVPGRVVQVPHGRLDVGVAHPFLHATNVGTRDHPRAERMAQVVEAQWTEASALERAVVAPAQR